MVANMEAPDPAVDTTMTSMFWTLTPVAEAMLQPSERVLYHNQLVQESRFRRMEEKIDTALVNMQKLSDGVREIKALLKRKGADSDEEEQEDMGRPTKRKKISSGRAKSNEEKGDGSEALLDLQSQWDATIKDAFTAWAQENPKTRKPYTTRAKGCIALAKEFSTHCQDFFLGLDPDHPIPPLLAKLSTFDQTTLYLGFGPKRLGEAAEKSVGVDVPSNVDDET